MVLTRLLAIHNIILTIIIALLFFYFLIKYTILEFIILISCKRGKAVNNLLVKTKDDPLLDGNKIIFYLLIEN